MTTSDPRPDGADRTEAAIAAFRSAEARPDLIDKVTGRTRFVADRPVPGALIGAVLTSPVPHARIRAVDADAARRLPGVRAVLTGEDLRGRRFGRRLLDRPVLCWDRVRFVGDRIAAVAADNEAIARAAIRAIRVDLEPLPPLFDLETADADDAPVLHPEWAGYRYLDGTRPPVPHPNVQGHQRVELGVDALEAAFASAAVVVEGTYHAPRQHAAHLEPHATIVEPLPHGRVRVHSTNKAPFSLRAQLAATFEDAPTTYEIDARAIGGDFGAKGYSVDEFVAVALARAAGAPVRMTMGVAEELSETSVRHAAVIRLRTALDGEGRILAHDAIVRFDGGAYAGAKPIPSLVPGGGTSALIAYHVPILRIDARALYTTTVPGGHVRAPGEVQAVFAGESHVDELARAAGLDPLAFRALNAVRPGQTGGNGHGFVEGRAVEVIGAMRDHTRSVPRAPRRGRGLAVSARHVGVGGAYGLTAAVERDGTVTVTTGLVDQGGGVHTVIRRVLAIGLGVTPERIHIRTTTTDGATPDRGVGASRSTHLASRAALALADAIHEALAERLPPDVPVTLEPTTLDRLVGPTPLVVSASYDSETAPGAKGHHDFTGCVVDVSVDPESGEIRIHDLLVVVDVGTIINPIGHRGQIIGGVVFGLGQALLEEIPVVDGRVLPTNLDGYRLPRATDLPPIRVVELPTRIGPGAFGAKMAGELTNSVVAPAIANAIADATGVRLRELPLTSARLRATIRAAR